MNCMVCKKPVTHKNPGRIIGQIQAHYSEPHISNYEESPVQVYHDTCEDEAMKIIIKQDEARFKRMGLIK